MIKYEEAFHLIDEFSSLEELKVFEKEYDENHIAAMFWEYRNTALEGETPLEREKARAKCRFICQDIGCFIPCNKEIKKFFSPHGLKGIFISSKASIGENCTIFPNVVIGSNTIIGSKKAGFPQIGNDVYIGAGSTIIGGVKIGNTVRIGANSVVVDDVDDNSLVLPSKSTVIHKDNINNKFLTPVQFTHRNPKAADGGRSIISKYSSTAYINEHIIESDGPNSVFETCRLLGYSIPEITDDPGKYIDLDNMYDHPEEMISHYISELELSISEEEALKKYRFFNRSFLRQSNFDSAKKTNCVVWFWDWIIFAWDRGCRETDYLDFEYYRRSLSERDKFINQGYRMSIARIANSTLLRNRDIFKNKCKFNTTFADFVNRDWIDTTKCTFDEFNIFLSKHSKFFTKPINGSGGHGASILDSSSDTAENLYKWCKDNGMIAEEIVKQHKEMSKYNDSTLNTLRIYTLIDANNNVNLIMGCARFGRKGKYADNFHQGGCGIIIDLETGTACSDAIDRNHSFTDVHPDSGYEFKEWKCPNWQAVVDCVKKSAKKTPNMRYIGWDIGITEEGLPELIEGNYMANIDLPQAADQIGKRNIVDPIIKELAAKQGINFPESEIWYR